MEETIKELTNSSVIEVLVISLAVTLAFFCLSLLLKSREVKKLKIGQVPEKYSKGIKEITYFQYNILQKMNCFEKLETGEIAPKDFRELFTKELKEKQQEIHTLGVKSYLKSIYSSSWIIFFVWFIGIFLLGLALKVLIA